MRKFIMLAVAVICFSGCGGNKPDATSKQMPASEPSSQESNQFIAKGMDHLRKKEVVKAIRNFDEAIRKEPTNANNYLVLGQVYLRLQNYTRAVDTLKAATQIDPNNGEAFYLLATSSALKSEKEKQENDLVESDLSKEIAIDSIKKSINIFMNERNEENFKRSVVLLQSLTQDPFSPEE